MRGRPASGARDHPRIRGEHLNERAARQRRKGSSPHTRGARRRVAPRAHGVWIIPAYAGSTTMRACSARSGAGSSPHTRGARIEYQGGDMYARIIPAYAGSTQTCIQKR